MADNQYYLEPTHKTPEITGDISNGKLFIKGKSIPEDAREFYFPFRNWVMDFVQSPSDSLKVEVQLEYFNTSTSSIFLDVFRLLLKASHEKDVKIIWYHEEDDMDIEEAGEDYKLMIGDIFSLEQRDFDY